MIKKALFLFAFFMLHSQLALGSYRIFLGPVLSYERTQEQVLEPRATASLSLGYELVKRPLAFEFEWSEWTQDSTGNPTLEIQSERSEYMIWTRYYNKLRSESDFRVFGSVGLGVNRYEVQTRLQRETQKMNSKWHPQAGVGLGLELRPRSSIFAIMPMIGIQKSPDRNPGATFFSTLNFGISFY